MCVSDNFDSVGDWSWMIRVLEKSARFQVILRPANDRVNELLLHIWYKFAEFSNMAITFYSNFSNNLKWTGGSY